MSRSHVGARDMTLPPSEARLAAAGIPGVGHQPMDERPQEFDRWLVEFLKRPDLQA